MNAFGVAKVQTVKYYVVAVGLYFVNSFFAEFGSLWLIGGVAATLASYYYAWRLHQRASDIEFA